MKVGYGRTIITPQEPMPLGGYGDSVLRMHEVVLDDLKCTCIAVTDDKNETVLLMGFDVLSIPEYAMEVLRAAVQKRTGMPFNRIMMAGTHTHSGPDMIEPAAAESDCVKRYVRLLGEWAADAAEEALADRKPACMLIGDIEVEGLNCVRHYTSVDTETGEPGYLGDNFGEGPTKRVVDHVTPVDKTMHLVKFQREGGKDVVIANWRGHASMTGGYYAKYLSADYIAPFRDVLEAQQDCLVLFLQGAAGNINILSRIPEENYSMDYRVMGARLAYFAVKGLETVQPAAMTRVKTKQVEYQCDINHTWDPIAEITAGMTARWRATHDAEYAMEPGIPHGVRSLYQAYAITQRSKMPKTMTLELNTIALGDDLAIITAPNELFDTNTVYVEDHAPYRKVLTMGYANGDRGYIPSEFGFEYTCYESDCCNCAPGSGEKVQEQFLKMLNEMKNA